MTDKLPRRTIRHPTLEREDPAPIPPVLPDIDGCCRSGCVPCVFDLYDEAMERYRTELKAWEARHASGRGHAGRSFSRAKTKTARVGVNCKKQSS